MLRELYENAGYPEFLFYWNHLLHLCVNSQGGLEHKDRGDLYGATARGALVGIAGIASSIKVSLQRAHGKPSPASLQAGLPRISRAEDM